MNKNVEILQLGAAILRKQAVPVVDGSATELVEIIEQMLNSLAESNGVGLAAPQIGYSVCIIVVASRPTPRYPTAPFMSPIVMINPGFQPLLGNQQKDWEGCLSIPGIRALVPRYQEIKVDYTNIDGVLSTIEFSGFVARIFQHEYDHLQGMVYLDRVENNKDIISETEFFKLLI